MSRKVALLRGVNVNGKNILPMASLRDALGKTSFYSVTTYIQSGNIVFNSDLPSAACEHIIEDLIQAEFGLNVPVVVKEQAVLKELILANPFKVKTTENPKFMSFGFLKSVPSEDKLALVAPFSTDIETFVIIDDVLYFYCGVGFGTTKMTNSWFENKLGVVSTMRNYNTATKLLTL